MRVKELIEKLKEFDQELPVFIDGYEDGCGEPDRIEEIEALENFYSKDSYCKPHREITEDDREYNFVEEDEQMKNFVILKAVIIGR